VPMQPSQSQIDAMGGCADCQLEPVPPPDAAEESGPSVLVVDPTKTAWIVIELVESTGRPRSGESFSLVAPDGTPVEGTLDSKGKVRIEGLDPGPCKVSFPALGYQQEASATSSSAAPEP